MPTTRVKTPQPYAMRLSQYARSLSRRTIMKNRIIKHTLLILFVCCFSSVAFGQVNLSEYLDQRIVANLNARVDQTDPTKQSETPAAAQNSTSLVERSSAPDLVGL